VSFLSIKRTKEYNVSPGYAIVYIAYYFALIICIYEYIKLIVLRLHQTPCFSETDAVIIGLHYAIRYIHRHMNAGGIHFWQSPFIFIYLTTVTLYSCLVNIELFVQHLATLALSSLQVEFSAFCTILCFYHITAAKKNIIIWIWIYATRTQVKPYCVNTR